MPFDTPDVRVGSRVLVKPRWTYAGRFAEVVRVDRWYVRLIFEDGTSHEMVKRGVVVVG